MLSLTEKFSIGTLFTVEQIKVFNLIVDKIKYPLLITDDNGNIIFSNQSGISIKKSIESSEITIKGFVINENSEALLSLEKIEKIFANGKISWLIDLENKKYQNIEAEIFKIDDWQGIWLVITNHGNYTIPTDAGNNNKSNEIANKFIANISHEFRTPLNGILGFSELLLKKNLSPEKQRDFISIIYNNATHLLHLSNDILDLARIESGKIQLLRTKFSINRLLYDLQLFFLLDLKNKGKQNIQFKISPGWSDRHDLIVADEIRIKQIIINLVGNAIKFTSKGEIIVGYKVKPKIELEFFIRDTGVGMNEFGLNQIFKRFEQANEKVFAKYGGTGLGLVISKELVELHMGRIWVESQPDIGSTFYFTIPLNGISDF
jgi:signal transduction histidine kinase